MLWANAAQATPFQSPEWLLPWVKRFGGNLSVLALRQRGRLIGIIPFRRRQEDEAKRCLAFLATGVSDYLDGIFEAGSEQILMAETLEWLRHDGVDICDLTDLPIWSPFLAVAALPDWQIQIGQHEFCPVLALPDRAAQLGRFVPGRQLDKLKYYRARARRECGMAIDCAGDVNLSDSFRLFVRLHRRRWAERGQEGVLADPDVQAFHLEAAAGFLREGMLRLYVLRLGAVPAGALYAFMHRRRAYYYLSGFDPKFKVYSPGMLLIGHAIEQAIIEGAEEFDFLRGREPL